MEIHEAIFGRRATRRYTAEPVSKSAIFEIVRAAVQAPSALNRQPWAFGVFHGRKLLEDFSRRAKAHLVATLSPSFDLHPRSETYADADYSIVHHAGTLVVIYTRPDSFHPAEECGLAAQNLMLAAHALGLATCPIGFMRPWLNLAEVKSEMGVREDFTAVFPFVVGFAAAPPPEVPRRDPEFLVWNWHDDDGENCPTPEFLKRPDHEPWGSPSTGSRPAPVIA